MRFPRLFFVIAGLALTVMTLRGSPPPGATNAGSPTAPKKEEAPAPPTLSPKIEAKLQLLYAKWRVERRKVLDERMAKEIDEVSKTTNLGADGQQTLKTSASQIAASATDEWMAAYDKRLRPRFTGKPPEEQSKMLDVRMTQIADTVRNDWPVPAFVPENRDDWIKAVDEALGPEKTAIWNKARADRQDKIEKEMADTLKRGADRIHDQQSRQVLAVCRQIETAASLPKEQAGKLEDLGKSVVDGTTERWRKRVVEMFLLMPDDQRKQFAQNPNMSVGTGANESALAQDTWKNGVAQLLTPEETARMQAFNEAHKEKRVHVMGQVMIMLLDEKIAFTSAQRQQLQPIADRSIKEVPELYPDQTTEPYYAFPPDTFFTAAGKATEAELKPILDETQLKHWPGISKPDDAAEVKPDDDDKSTPDAVVEPEDVEKMISSFFYRKTQMERKRLLATNILRAEDAARVAGLSAETAARLQVAARGATEEALTSWKWFIEQQVRGQLGDLTPQNVKQRLDSLQDYLFQRNFGMQSATPALWDETVKTELNAKQQAAWQKETDARANYHDKAIAGLILTEFDRRHDLSADQWQKLEPVITSGIHDYSPDISRVFSSGNDTPWYMGSAYMFLPFAGVPEKDLKDILTKEQYTDWTGSQECANASNIWSMVQNLHNQRVRVLNGRARGGGMIIMGE